MARHSTLRPGPPETNLKFSHLRSLEAEHGLINHFLPSYGYLAVFLFVMLDAVGSPLPGETAAIAAALYAGSAHRLNIGLIALAQRPGPSPVTTASTGWASMAAPDWCGATANGCDWTPGN